MSIHTNWIVKYRSQIPYVNQKINRMITYMKYWWIYFFLTADEFQYLDFQFYYHWVTAVFQ